MNLESNRGNNNSDDNGENGNGGDDTSVPSSSWSRGGYHSRGGRIIWKSSTIL